MRVAKRICAFALALTIAFLSVGYEPPKANASLLASVGWSCAVSAYLNGIGLTMDATCEAAEDIAYDVREWHENTIMPIWEKYEKAIDATFDYATLIANGVNMSVSKQVRFSPELCSIFSEFAVWLISEYGLEEAEEPILIPSVDSAFVSCNGIIVPAFPDYDQSIYPYAILSQWDDSYVVLTVSQTGAGGVTPPYWNYNGLWTKTYLSYRCYLSAGEWGNFTSGDNTYVDTLSYIKWVNFDLSDANSNFIMAGSIPEVTYDYENPAMVLSISPSYAGAPDVSEGKELVVALPADSDITSWDDFRTYVAQQDLEGIYTPEAVTVEDAQTGTTEGEDTEEDTATLIGTTNGILDWTKKIWQSIKDIPKDIADMLTHAFVLSDEYAEALPQILTDTFAERTGFLTYPMSLLFGFVDLIATPAGDFILEWDDVYEPFSRGKLISAGQFNVTQYVNSDEALSNVYSLWKTVVSGYLIFMFFDLCYKKYNAIVRDRLG